MPARRYQRPVQPANHQQQDFGNQIQNLSDVQHNVFVTIGNRMDSIDQRLGNIETMLVDMNLRLDKKYGYDKRLSFANKFIYEYLSNFNWSQCIKFFQRFLDHINDGHIPPIDRDEKRKKSLLVHKLDIFWDRIQPNIDDNLINRIKDAIRQEEIAAAAAADRAAAAVRAAAATRAAGEDEG